MNRSESSWRPRNGRRWIVVIVARISTGKQDPRSLDDQSAVCTQRAHSLCPGEVDVRVIQSVGSGEHLDRKELVELEELIESEQVDLIIVEDLGRICRRNRAIDFCELALDHGTRLVSINDHVDTNEGAWRLSAVFASLHHEVSNEDTAQRIKRSHRNRFAQGSLFQHAIYGYVKPEGKSHEDDITLLPEAKQVYDEWFRRLEDGATFAEVADWLNRIGVKPGTLCRRQTWDADMVARVTYNTLLKGLRFRNRQESRRVNKTGRRKNFPAAPGLTQTRFCPHLVAIDPDRYDRVVRLLKERNGRFARGQNGRGDCRRGVPKKRTRWPGQHARCGVCNRLLHWGGHGRTTHMVCSGCRYHACWNSATFDGAMAARRMAEVVLETVRKLPDFDAMFLAQLELDVTRGWDEANHERAGVERRLREIEAEIRNVATAIAKLGMSSALEETLTRLEAEKHKMDRRLDKLRVHREKRPSLPSAAEIRRLTEEVLADLAVDSPEFGRLMSRLLPSVRVFPYRLCDGPNVVQRAHVVAELGALLGLRGRAADLLRREIEVDLFVSPQRELYRPRVVEMRRQGLTQREIAAALGITLPAVQHALALQTRMDQLGLTDPYVLITEPDPADRKRRRHRHERFRFSSLPEKDDEKPAA